jgi:hypothetical protein
LRAARLQKLFPTTQGIAMHPFSLTEKEIEQVSGGVTIDLPGPGKFTSLVYGEEGGTLPVNAV